MEIDYNTFAFLNFQTFTKEFIKIFEEGDFLVNAGFQFKGKIVFLFFLESGELFQSDALQYIIIFVTMGEYK